MVHVKNKNTLKRVVENLYPKEREMWYDKKEVENGTMPRSYFKYKWGVNPEMV